jgi:hypothetical protein
VKDNPAQGIVCDLVESYETETKLLEEVIEYTERSQKLAEEGDFPALCHCLLGRGERIEAIAQLEVKRASLEKELSGRLPDDVKEAESRALIAHRKALLANNRLRALLAELKTVFEGDITALEQKKTATGAYNEVKASSSHSMFLDRER